MPQPLASKERSLFSQLVKNYENKQYKKGLKAVEQILKKNPNHGDTQAMKALIINSQGHTDEAFALAKVALTSDMKSHVCWHVYGLLWRSVKNFEEAIKAYKWALKLDPDSQQIQRDLALLQIQMRDYPGYVQSRRSMLQARPAFRANWTALAVAQHLDGDVEGAERTLTMYEESLRSPPSKSDIEHQECALYKNTLIAEMGQLEKALEHLDSIKKNHFDQQTIMEMRAAYKIDLGKQEEAAEIYRTLLHRNPENRAYYAGLRKALEIGEDDVSKLKELYGTYAEKFPRSDAPRRIPLDFLEGQEFRAAADAYLQRMLRKGVPSTFANIKLLYSDSEKQDTIQSLVEGYASGKTESANGSANKDQKEGDQAQFELWTIYFLAQHYDYHKSRDLTKAMKFIKRALEKKPDSVDFTMTEARILKHMGNIRLAAETMERARALDEKDRYINTKAAKYQLRDDMNEAALSNVGKFTRQEAAGGPLGDLIDMQSMWFLWEDGASFLRQNKLGLALKRFTTIYNIFDVWQEDQFDFHTYSMRKGQVRAYLDLIRFEDRLREHPFYTRAAVAAIQIYILLFDQPGLADGKGAAAMANGESSNSSAAKKAAKKARKEKEKQEQSEAEKKDAKKTAGVNADGEKKKPDLDPEGKELLATEDPLQVAMKFLEPMLEHSPKDLEAQIAGFELYLRRKKYLLALKCLLAAKDLSAEPATTHSQALRLAIALVNNPETLLVPVATTIQRSMDELLTSKPTTIAQLRSVNEAFMSSHKSDPRSILAFWEVQSALDPSSKGKASEAVAEAVSVEKATLQDATRTVRWCRDWGVGDATVLAAAKKKWPEASSIRENRAG